MEIENPPDEQPGSNKPGAGRSGITRYRFRVDENFNGAEAKEVDVYTDSNGDCGYSFEAGTAYLVNPRVDGARWFAMQCSWIQPAATAGLLISELRALRDRVPHASIYGVLQRTQAGADMWDDYDRPLAGITVDLKGEEHWLSAVTDGDGIYRFYSVPADTYRFHAALPPGLELAQTDPRPTILPENACYQKDLEAFPIAKIRGRVLGPDGAPLKHAQVALFRADQYSEDSAGWLENQDAVTGYFEFAYVVPGAYLLVFHDSDEADPDDPYPRTFYPASPDRKNAQPVIVEEGQQIVVADIHAGAPRPTRTLTVHLFDGAEPAREDSSVIAEGEEGDQPSEEKVSPGLYRVTLFQGERYEVFAQRACATSVEGAPVIGYLQSHTAQIESSDANTEITLNFTDSTCRPQDHGFTIQ